MTLQITGHEALMNSNSPNLRVAKQEFTNMARVAAEMHDNHPDRNMRAVERYLHDYAQASLTHDQAMTSLESNLRAAGGKDIRSDMQAASQKLRNEFTTNFLQTTLPQYNENERQAFMKFAQKASPPTLPGLAIGQFYDEDSEKPRWAGIIGGLVGGLYIFNKLGGMGGGWLGWIGTALAVVAGGWLTNKGMDLFERTFGSKKNQGAPAPVQEPSREVDLKDKTRVREKENPVKLAADLKLGEIVPNIAMVEGETIKDVRVADTMGFMPDNTPTIKLGPQPGKPVQRGS